MSHLMSGRIRLYRFVIQISPLEQEVMQNMQDKYILQTKENYLQYIQLCTRKSYKIYF